MAQPPKGAKNGDMRIDPALVRELAQLLTDNELTEIEVQDGDRRIKVQREPAPVVGAAPLAPALAASPALSAPAAHAKEDLAAPAQEEISGHTIKSPMVGTAYLSPEPGAAPFIKIGDTVNAGQTLMVVEAMKTFNPIPAPRAGKVTAILVTDAQPVEYGEALVILE